MAGLSIPGNSCCSKPPIVNPTGCQVRLSGQCVYYSGPPITSTSINTGDLLDTVISKLSQGGGGTLTGADNGLSLSTTNVQLGQTVAASGNPAILLSNREIPLGGFNIYASGNGALVVGSTLNDGTGSTIQSSGSISCQNSGTIYLNTNSSDARLRIISGNPQFVDANINSSSDTSFGFGAGGNGINIGSTTAFGFNCLGNSSLTGINNTAVGTNALSSTSTGRQNTAMGLNAGFTNAIGNQNVYIGDSSGLVATGDQNTLVGANTFLSIGLNHNNEGANGSANTAIGYNAGGGGLTFTTSTTNISNCIFVGVANGPNAEGITLTNTSIIGNSITTNLNNVAIFGRSDQNIILGQTTPTTNNGYKLQVNGGITLAQTSLPGSPVNGAIEQDGTNFYYTIGGVRNAFGSGGVSLPGSGTRSVIANPDGTLFTDVNAYPTDLITGREYIFAFHKKFYTFPTDGFLVPVVTLSGDSTTFGTGVTDTKYLLQNILQSIALNVTSIGMNIFNDGVPSTDTQDWITSQLPGTLARNPDLMIIRWGINDAAIGATQFETNLRAGLTTIRAQGDVTKIAIILMAPNSTNDTPNGRDAAWYELINPIIRKAAKDFLCVYVDTFHYFHDSTNATDLLWMTNDFGDGRHIHPAEMENMWITSIIADIIFPTSFKSLLGSGLIRNNSSIVRLPNAGDAVTTYPIGISMYRATPINGWPNDGMVVTFYNPDGVLLQLNSAYNANTLSFRTGQSSGFGSFVSVP